MLGVTGDVTSPITLKPDGRESARILLLLGVKTGADNVEYASLPKLLRQCLEPADGLIGDGRKLFIPVEDL
jgi:hypothetical protein